MSLTYLQYLYGLPNTCIYLMHMSLYKWIPTNMDNDICNKFNMLKIFKRTPSYPYPLKNPQTFVVSGTVIVCEFVYNYSQYHFLRSVNEPWKAIYINFRCAIKRPVCDKHVLLFDCIFLLLLHMWLCTGRLTVILSRNTETIIYKDFCCWHVVIC